MLTRLRRTVPAALSATVMGLILVACGVAASPERDNAKQARPEQINSDPPYIVQMPDHFNNVAVKCDHFGNLVYVTSNKDTVPSSLYVVPNAEGCKR